LVNEIYQQQTNQQEKPRRRGAMSLSQTSPGLFSRRVADGILQLASLGPDIQTFNRMNRNPRGLIVEIMD
jgi:hypothetical protein